MIVKLLDGAGTDIGFAEIPDGRIEPDVISIRESWGLSYYIRKNSNGYTLSATVSGKRVDKPITPESPKVNQSERDDRDDFDGVGGIG